MKRMIFYLSHLPRPRLLFCRLHFIPLQLCQTRRKPHKPHKYLVQCDGWCGSVYGLQNKKKARVTCLLFTRIREIKGEVGGDSLSSHRARHLLLGPGLALSQMSQMSPVCPRARVLGSVTVNLSWSQPAEPPGLSELNKQTSNTKDLDNHNAMLWIENKSTLFKSRCLLKIRFWGST